MSGIWNRITETRYGRMALPLVLTAGVLFTACEEIAEVPDISASKVHLMAPSDGARVQGNAVTFTWEPVEDAESYVIQVATPDFPSASQVVINQTIKKDTLGNALPVSLTREMLPNTYEWRVKAVNSGYETPFSTHAFTLTIGEDFADNTVILNGPEEGFITNEASVDLTWNALKEATGYRLQVLQDEDVVTEEAVEEPEITVTFEEGSFTWQVRAEKGEERTLYSSRTLLVDLTAPNVAKLMVPADESVSSQTEVTFTWTRENRTGSAEYDKIYIYSDQAQESLVKEEEVSNKTLTTTLEEGVYYWNVKSFDRAGNTGELSATFSFTIN